MRRFDLLQGLLTLAVLLTLMATLIAAVIVTIVVIANGGLP